MNKIQILILCSFLLTSSIVISQETVQSLNDVTSLKQQPSLLTEESHTVFAEYATTTWCPNCPVASSALYELSQTTTQPFTYVTLVTDVNKNARERSRNGYYNVAIPSVYFDGGYKHLIGSGGTTSATMEIYSDLIDDSLLRKNIKDVLLQTQATWQGNAELNIQVTITNNELLPYIGFVKTYVTEIESRWEDYAGDPYHYALLDFAIETPIILFPKQTRTLTANWDGKQNHNGLSFPDITQDNILISSAVFHFVPYLKKGYETDQFTQRYFGFYADQSDSTFPE